jgi:hypothetical protein
LTTRSRLVLAAHRIVLRTARTPLGRLWGFAYRSIARLGAAYIAAGEPQPTTYARGSLSTADLLPGLSDIDLTIVLTEDPAGRGVARERATERWQRLRRAVPATDLVLDYPRVLEQPDLADLNGASALTYGLDAPDPAPAGYFGPAASADRARMLDRPGLYGTADWRLVSGPERRPPEPERDTQLQRIAGWLELVHWWQWAFGACVDPMRPRTAHLCLKLVTEPARIWLWLACRERPSGRVEVLTRALRRMPEEEEALRRALELDESLARAPKPPLDEVLPVLVRLSARIASLVCAGVAEEGATEVRLAGADPAELLFVLRRQRPRHPVADGTGPPALPLCDWRSLVRPRPPDQALVPLPGHPADPDTVAAAALSRDIGPYPALRTGGLLVLPAGSRVRSRLRAVQCSATDPVSFALLEGERVARFPRVRGWSAQDTARRAVAEHRARIETRISDDGDELGMLITAARAALFAESLTADAPEIQLTATATLRELGARSRAGQAVTEKAVEGYREFALRHTQPAPALTRAMRELVRKLPAYTQFG